MNKSWVVYQIAFLLVEFIKVAQIAMGEIEEKPDEGKEYVRKGGLIGGRARAEKLSPQKRK